MTSPVINEQFYTGGFIVSQANGHRSKDTVFMDNTSGADLLLSAGLVVTENGAGTATATAAPGNHGNGTSIAVTVLGGAIFGTYELVALTATSFSVTAPTGDALPNLIVGTAYADEIGLTITAGGTAFQAGDSFAVNVASTGSSWSSWTGGAFTQLGLLYNRTVISAGTAKKVTVVTREAEVNAAELQWDPAVLAAGNVATLQANALAALATAGIIAR